MPAQCEKCQQAMHSLQILTCGHGICYACIKPSPYTEQAIITCPSCHTMTLVKADQQLLDADPENFVVCLDCKSQIMSTRVFLQGRHRRHDVVSVASVVPDVQKNLRKYQLSLDLENQALYSQVELLSKEKRIISEDYSRNSMQVRLAFEQLYKAVKECEEICTTVYEKLVLDVVETLDDKIRQIKTQIVKCQSYMESIDHTLVKAAGSRHVASVEFYFGNLQYFEKLVNQLIKMRRSQLEGSQLCAQIKSPNLNPIKEFAERIRNTSLWRKQESEQKQQPKTNPETEAQHYFETKRREIFNMKGSNMVAQASNQGRKQAQDARNLQVSRMSRQEPGVSQSFNIEGRIENLRKALKLGDRVSSPKSSQFFGPK